MSSRFYDGFSNGRRVSASGLSAILHEFGRFATETAILRNISKRVTLPYPPQRKGTSGKVPSSFFLGLESGPEQIFKSDVSGWDMGWSKRSGHRHIHKCDFDEENDHKPLKSIGFWGTFRHSNHSGTTCRTFRLGHGAHCAFAHSRQEARVQWFWMASWGHDTSQYISPNKSQSRSNSCFFFMVKHHENHVKKSAISHFGHGAGHCPAAISRGGGGGSRGLDCWGA